MATEGRQTTIPAILVAAAVLLWPALWNGYPLLFADTGTYLSQAIKHYLGWDRPVFYSLFLFPLHWTITTWPVIVAQALLAAHTLHLVRRTLLPAISPWWLPAAMGFATIATALPWFAAQLVPDVFTALLVVALALLVLAPERLTRWERGWLVVFAAFMIAAHQSHVPLSLILLAVLLPLRRWLGAATPLGRHGVALAIAPALLAMTAMVLVNIAGFGRVALSPYGNVFLLARVVYDGPGMHALQRDCPDAHWRLCAFLGEFPANSDDFLWRQDGPVIRAGGAKIVSTEADAIILSALRAEPGTELLAFLLNGMRQLGQFATGDGLQPWTSTVSPWIERAFPHHEVTALAASRQAQGTLVVPPWMQTLHTLLAIMGVTVCAATLPVARQRRSVAAGFIAAVLLAVLANAMITGGLSGPHDRYQSRIMWLPPLCALLAIPTFATRGVAATLGWLTAMARHAAERRSHASNIFWSGLEAASSATLSFASAFIVARLVGPAEVGIGAAVVAVHVLLWVAVNALFADPLVQRATVDDRAFSSAFCASIGVGGAAALLQLAVAQPVAWWIGDGRLIPMAALLALPLPLVGAAGPVQGLLTRNRAYRTLAGRTLIGQGLGTATGIAAALLGFGAWSIVLQQFISSAAGALVLLLRCPGRPHAAIHWQDLRAMLRIGVPLTASTLVQHGRYRLFALLIGGTAGVAALGQVHMAFRLVDTVRELAFTAQWRLMLPLLSERQDDLPALHARMDRCLWWSSLLAFPLCGAMALSIQPLVRLLLGPVWLPSSAAALPLIALTAWLFLAFPAGVAVIARGVPRYTLIANIAGTVATACGVMLVRPASPLQAVLVWLGAQAFVSPYVLRANARVLHTGLLRPLRAGLPVLGATTLAVFVAFTLPHATDAAGSALSLVVLRLVIVVLAGGLLGLPLVLMSGRWLARRATVIGVSGPAPPGGGTLTHASGSDP